MGIHVRTSVIGRVVGDVKPDMDQIYSFGVVRGFAQEQEIATREMIAGKTYDDYYWAISESYSIPVMDYEVHRLLRQIPKGGGDS